MKNHITIPELDNSAYILFRIMMLPIMGTFIYISNFYFSTPINERAWVINEIYTMLDYTTLSFTLLFCGVLLFDIGLKKGFTL